MPRSEYIDAPQSDSESDSGSESEYVDESEDEDEELSFASNGDISAEERAVSERRMVLQCLITRYDYDQERFEQRRMELIRNSEILEQQTRELTRREGAIVDNRRVRPDLVFCIEVTKEKISYRQPVSGIVSVHPPAVYYLHMMIGEIKATYGNGANILVRAISGMKDFRGVHANIESDHNITITPMPWYYSVITPIPNAVITLSSPEESHPAYTADTVYRVKILKNTIVFASHMKRDFTLVSDGEFIIALVAIPKNLTVKIERNGVITGVYGNYRYTRYIHPSGTMIETPPSVPVRLPIRFAAVPVRSATTIQRVFEETIQRISDASIRRIIADVPLKRIVASSVHRNVINGRIQRVVPIRRVAPILRVIPDLNSAIRPVATIRRVPAANRRPLTRRPASDDEAEHSDSEDN
jgi:hypothetical protein